LTAFSSAAYDADMGTFSVAVQIGDPKGERWEWTEALVDTGATYTWLPAPFLRDLGIIPTRTFPFILADGRRIEREMAEVRLRHDGQIVTTLVIFGDPGTEPLLGAYSLEGLGLAPDLVNRRLIPVPGYLM
jgi:predicted aspartyl protease